MASSREGPDGAHYGLTLGCSLIWIKNCNGVKSGELVFLVKIAFYVHQISET